MLHGEEKLRKVGRKIGMKPWRGRVCQLSRTVVLLAVVAVAGFATAGAAQDGPVLKPPALGELGRGEVSGVPSGNAKNSAQQSASGPVIEPLMIDNFDRGEVSGISVERPNMVGAYQGTYSHRPSYAILSKTSAVRLGERGRGLVIDYSSQAGSCGWYTLLNGVDASPYNALTFWVRGEAGGEKFDIGLADLTMYELEMDAVILGSVTDFLPPGVTTRWQKVKVPLKRVSTEINLERMGNLIFDFRYGGDGRVYVEDVQFERDDEILKLEEENTPKAIRDPEHPRGLWVWKLDPIINVKQRKPLFDFCERTAVERIYLFLHSIEAEADSAFVTATAEFLTEASRHGIQVEALTGEPTWAFRENHHLALAWLKGFLSYNEGRPPEQRFVGAQLDVEPYLTMRWKQDKEALCAEFLEMLVKCKQLIADSGQEFRLGLAMPVFYADEPEAFQRGILESIDYMALMDYYDTERRILEGFYKHSLLAQEYGKPIAIGLETQDLIRMKQGRAENTFFDEGWKEMERVLERVAMTVRDDPAYLGLAIHHEGSYHLMTPNRNVPMNPDRPRGDATYQVYATNVPNASITIDGRRDDWGRCEVACELSTEPYAVYGKEWWKGPEDLSMAMYAAWDSEFLYFLFDVKDNVLWQEKRQADIWAGDHVELWLDVDLEPDFFEAVNSQDDIQLGFSPGNFTTVPVESFIWTPQLSDKESSMVQLAAQRTSTGYVLEAAIPWDDLFDWATRPQWTGEFKEWGPTLLVPPMPRLKPVSGLRMGVSVDVSDTDEEKMQQKCFLSSSVNRAWGDPSTFGELVLK